jgi:hypothetical protein
MPFPGRCQLSKRALTFYRPDAEQRRTKTPFLTTLSPAESGMGQRQDRDCQKEEYSQHDRCRNHAKRFARQIQPERYPGAEHTAGEFPEAHDPAAHLVRHDRLKGGSTDVFKYGTCSIDTEKEDERQRQPRGQREKRKVIT